MGATSTSRRLPAKRRGPGSQFRRRRPGRPAPDAVDHMANISLAIPTIHPSWPSSPTARQPPAGVHRSLHYPSADQAVFDAALAMAWTTVDAATNPALRTDCWRWAMILEHAVLEVRPARAPRSRQPSPRPSTSSPPPRAARASGWNTASKQRTATCCWSSGSRSRRTPVASATRPPTAVAGAPAPLLRPVPVVEHFEPSTRRSRRRAAGPTHNTRDRQ